MHVDSAGLVTIELENLDAETWEGLHAVKFLYFFPDIDPNAEWSYPLGITINIELV